MPWKLSPGDSGEIPVTMSTAGKMGSIEKAVMVDSTTGTKTLIVKANMPAAGNQPIAGGIDPDRLKNMQMALADRQRTAVDLESSRRPNSLALPRARTSVDADVIVGRRWNVGRSRSRPSCIEHRRRHRGSREHSLDMTIAATRALSRQKMESSTFFAERGLI
jgi:hypothetical protein